MLWLRARGATSLGAPLLRARANRAASGGGAAASGQSAPATTAGVTSTNGLPTSPEQIDARKLYRDCLKLTRYVAARSAKGNAMAAMIRSSFRANMQLVDETEINKAKMQAIMGIQNYVIHDTTSRTLARKSKSEIERARTGKESQEPDAET